MAWEWILSMLGSGAVAAVLLGVAGYLGRSQLAHWLNKDIEKIKAEHNRQLEAYKVSLIAEAERTKASQEVRKAVAVRMAEKRFAAIDGLHKAYVKQTQLFVMLSMWYESGQAAEEEAVLRLAHINDDFSGACKLAQPFLVAEDHSELTDMAFHCAALLLEVAHESAEVVKATMDRVRPELIRRLKECEAIIEGEVRGLLDMTR